MHPQSLKDLQNNLWAEDRGGHYLGIFNQKCQTNRSNSEEKTKEEKESNRNNRTEQQQKKNNKKNKSEPERKMKSGQSDMAEDGTLLG